jgi:uncharacterized protein (TIGR02466 family)
MPDVLTSIYPTTLFRRHLPDMTETNRQLAGLIAEIAATGPNKAAGTSTEGGFQTSEDLLSEGHPFSNHPALVTLKRHLIAAIQDYAKLLFDQECRYAPTSVDFMLWGWGVSLRAGNSQDLHVHPTAHISGVYYISSPPGALAETSTSGKIRFYDPRPRANMSQLFTQITRHSEMPSPGDILLFPSWLEHSVAPFYGEGERLCITFNVRLAMA